jgi:hypothetical protein
LAERLAERLALRLWERFLDERFFIERLALRLWERFLDERLAERLALRLAPPDNFTP